MISAFFHHCSLYAYFQSLLKLLQNIYTENNYNQNYIYKNYIIQYFAYFSNIIDSRNKTTKKLKLNNIKKLINSKDYRITLTQIKNNSNFKHKLICTILLTKNAYLVYFLGFLANQYDKYNKKKKYH